MDRPNNRVLLGWPAVNLVSLVAAVAVMWWRIGRLEQTQQGLEAAVRALQVEVAVMHQALDKP